MMVWGDSMTVGALLRQARTEVGLTQERVADIIGVSRNTITRYENSVLYPRQAVLRVLAHVYGKPLEWFTGDEADAGVEDPLGGGDSLEFLLSRMSLSLRENGVGLSDEGLRSVGDYIRFIQDKERIERDKMG